LILNIKKLTRGAHVLKAVALKYRWKFIGMAVLGILAGFSGGIGIGAVIPLFALMTNQSLPETNFITNAMYKVFGAFHVPFTPSYLILFIVSLFLLKALIQFSAKFFNERIVAEFEEELRNDLYHRTLETQWSYLMNQKVGYLERILLFDIQQSASIISQVNSGLLMITSILMYALVAFNISASITLLTLAIGVILFWVFKPFFYRARKLAASIGETYREASHHVTEHIIGAKVAKANGIEYALSELARKYFRRLRDARVKTALYSNIAGNLTEPIGFLFVAIVFLMTFKHPAFNIAAFAVVVYLIQKMFSFIQSMQGQIQGLGELLPYFETTVRYREQIIQNHEAIKGTKPFTYAKTLSFRNVSFTYNKREPVFHDISFSIPRGAIVAITGPSGMGKTTLADLILRLLEPTNGTLVLDGVPLQEISIAEWRKNVAYVPQEIFLLNGSIEDNIRYFNASLSTQDIEMAARMANIYDTIMALPGGFDEPVGERGLRLSGGQRQRIVLARALARRPQILILDEPTSALDKESEQLILQALQQHRGKITIITIAHGSAFTDFADYRIVVDNGTIIANA